MSMLAVKLDVKSATDSTRYHAQGSGIVKSTTCPFRLPFCKCTRSQMGFHSTSLGQDIQSVNGNIRIADND